MEVDPSLRSNRIYHHDAEQEQDNLDESEDHDTDSENDVKQV